MNSGEITSQGCWTQRALVWGREGQSESPPTLRRHLVLILATAAIGRRKARCDRLAVLVTSELVTSVLAHKVRLVIATMTGLRYHGHNC